MEKRVLGRREFEYPNSLNDEYQLRELCAAASADPALFLKKLAVALVQSILTGDIHAKDKAKKLVRMLWIDGSGISFFLSSNHPILGNEFKELVSQVLSYFIATEEFPDVEKTWSIRHCCPEIVDFINKRGNIFGRLADGYTMHFYEDDKERTCWYKRCPFCNTEFRLPKEKGLQLVEDLPPDIREMNKTYDAHMKEWLRQREG